MQKYAFLTLCKDEIALRFDLTAEVLITPINPDEAGGEGKKDRKHLVLAHVSSEELCDVIIRSGVSAVICGGIEEDYYHYLRWKRIEVISDVMGSLEETLKKLAAGTLKSGDCLYEKVPVSFLGDGNAA